MKKLILGLLLLVSFNGWGQQDTLEYTNPREVADTVFGLFDEQLYDNVLFDRSLSEDSLLIQQLRGDYSVVASALSWLQAHSDIAVSYTDPLIMMADSVMIDSLSSFVIKYDKLDSLERAHHPFGILLHQVSKIDSNLYQQTGSFTNLHGQLKLSSTYNENQIYDKVTLKETALLELYGDHGYEEGVIVYNPNFISVGANITLHSIRIDVGNGFQDFSSTNNEISYDIYQDWQIGKTILDYTLEGVRKQDTLSFYLTTKIYDIPRTRGVDRWDVKNEKYNSDLRYSIKYGCGNEEKIRRPIIIVPPYRPSLQLVSFNKYYDQFDFKLLISSLSDMGYDVVFIKQTPGNRGINHAGDILAKFIKDVNLTKKQNFPNEDWENILIGFSAGGQHCRWALKSLEKEHMDTGTPHHHTRLYIPFDSPHWGANIPMFTQSVYKEMSATLNIFGMMAYNSLKDAASKDMAMNHILGSQIINSGKNRTIEPHPTSERENIVYHLENSFNHQFTETNDLRKTFPSFTRNVAVSVGGNTNDYTNEYTLNPGMKLFEQNFFVPKWYGGKYFNRHISSAQNNSASSVFYRLDIFTVALAVPIVRNRHYKTKYAFEWDMAQGGYKNEFFDKPGLGFVPIDPVSILRLSGGFLIGTKLYSKNVSFLPMVSALAINPTIWQNNDLYYNLKDEGLMYNKFDIQNNPPSNIYGYPNLAHPNTHFNITPFEAIYSDPQTYEHIKMKKSVEDDDNLDEAYLVHTRNFILDEVEADVVYLQNKTIGKNHLQWDPNYRYKAWYKAFDKVILGDTITPKTDLGPYIIEKTGEVTAYACNGVVMKPGFHTKQGSKYHAFVYCDGCSRPREQGMKTNTGENNKNRTDEKHTLQVNHFNSNDIPHQKTVLKVYPNPSDKGFTIEFPEIEGEYIISNTNGELFQQDEVKTKSIFIELPKGIYFAKWINKNGIQTQKIIAL